MAPQIAALVSSGEFPNPTNLKTDRCLDATARIAAPAARKKVLQEVEDLLPVPTMASTLAGIPVGAINADTLLGFVETSPLCITRENQPELARSIIWNSGRRAHSSSRATTSTSQGSATQSCRQDTNFIFRWDRGFRLEVFSNATL